MPGIQPSRAETPLAFRELMCYGAGWWAIDALNNESVKGDETLEKNEVNRNLGVLVRGSYFTWGA